MKKILIICAVLLYFISFASADELKPDVAALVRESLISTVTPETDAWEKFFLEQTVYTQERSAGAYVAGVLSWDIDTLANNEDLRMSDVSETITQNFVTGNITISYDASGSVQLSGVDLLRKNIVSAASKAKNEFNTPWFSLALTNELFPAVYAENGGYTEIFEEIRRQYAGAYSPFVLEAALKLQRPEQLNVDAGPKALKITLRRADIDTVARNAYVATYDSLKGIDKANAYTRVQLNDMLLNSFIQCAAAVPDEEITLQSDSLINMESVLSGDLRTRGVTDYANEIQMSLTEKLDTLQIAVSYLPDYPQRNQPDTGVIKGPVSGTHVLFKSPNDGCGRIVTLTVPETGQTALELFMQSGSSVDAYVPYGKYVLTYGKGYEWYGDIKRFGSDAVYASSVVYFEVMQSDKYHVVNFIGTDISGASGVKIPMSLDDYSEPD